ncbi:hypothetical protein F5141DRAFT_1187094 [Pisolithus sp. B1]|nr:hypothetical protein F5141DRAFT_1187094 [Pisolithus sp. B1]
MVLDGTEPLNVSHTSGEFQELTRGLLSDFWKSTSKKTKGKCSDYHAFQDHSTKQTAAFSVQKGAMAEAYMAWSLKHRGMEEEQRNCDGMDTKLLSMPVLDVFCGMIGTEKTSITVGPTDHYLTSALVCHGLIPCSPITLKVAVTVHVLDLYHTTHQHCPHLLIQAYVKLLFLAFVSNLVHHALQHDQPNWWLKHSCPPCTYRMLDEPAMCFAMLFTQDRNDSLKQVAMRILDGNVNHVAASLPTSEHTFHHEQYLTHEFINKFASDQQMGHSIIDEDGIFIAVCWHGFCLLIANMVQSGKQSKYALTVTSKLLDAFGPDLGGSYDISCQFKTTLASSILGKCAQSLNYMSLVNAFHGHTHNRLCQLDNLMTYVEGLGLKDLEGCEWAFSKSNTLALSTQYASIFHRRQAITSYFEHSNEMEVHANLISDLATFKLWLDKDHVYLKSFLCKIPEETLQMDYWQDLKVILSTWTIVTAQSAAPIWSDSGVTRRRETMHCHAQENYEKDLKVVQELEGHLEITCHWYQHALDNLSKMNQSGTRYKLHKHIGKALQTCLVAIWAALTHYNTAAKALGCQTLEFDELAINTYFKLCQTEEEVVHLNVEIHHIVTYLIDEDHYDAHPVLAYQISRY